MEQQPGFSLVEVLLSLMLMTSIALALLQQQGSISHLFSQLLKASRTANFIHNQSELTREHTL
jgi:prepilin-type N-terminal cleavage/methylation domain-containing protein